MDSWQHLFCNCIDDNRKNILIIYDESTEELRGALENVILNNGKNFQSIKLNVMQCHGEEPSTEIKAKMLSCDAIICLTQYSLAHTDARRQATEKGITFLSLPGFSDDILENRAIFADYKSKLSQVEKYTELLTRGKNIVIQTEKGTKLRLGIDSRQGNCCPGLTNQKYLLGSPPDIEANIAPLENRTNGCLVVDGSITDYRLGLLTDIVRLDIKDGIIQNIFSQDKRIESTVKEIFRSINSEKAYIVGEFGIGFNNLAGLCGNMLIDEGTSGCVHFGMGSNWTIGGRNKVNFHLDFVIRNATVRIDDMLVIDKGELIYVG